MSWKAGGLKLSEWRTHRGKPSTLSNYASAAERAAYRPSGDKELNTFSIGCPGASSNLGDEWVQERNRGFGCVVGRRCRASRSVGSGGGMFAAREEKTEVSSISATSRLFREGPVTCVGQGSG